VLQKKQKKNKRKTKEKTKRYAQKNAVAMIMIKFPYAAFCRQPRIGAMEACVAQLKIQNAIPDP
jgi:hypothetical protein